MQINAWPFSSWKLSSWKRTFLTLTLLEGPKVRPLCYFTLSNTRRFYSSKESPWVGNVKWGLLTHLHELGHYDSCNAREAWPPTSSDLTGELRPTWKNFTSTVSAINPIIEHFGVHLGCYCI